MAYVTMINEKDTDVSQDDDCTAETEGDVMTLHRKDDTDEESNDCEESDDEASDLRERTIRSCIRSRPCSICLYLTLSLVMLASIVSLIVIGVLIVAPYRKASTFLDTKCETVTVEVEADHRRCSCGKGCNSKYPCIRVTVRSDQMGGVLSMDHVVMYENEATLLRHARPKCSYYPPCKSSKLANEKAVRDYEQMYGTPGKKFSCLYNPSNPTEVIRTRRFHLNHVIHGMVWSSLVFILSLVILIVAIRKKGCDFL